MVLLELLGQKRLHLNDQHRCRLAVNAKAHGRQVLVSAALAGGTLAQFVLFSE